MIVNQWAWPPLILPFRAKLSTGDLKESAVHSDQSISFSLNSDDAVANYSNCLHSWGGKHQPELKEGGKNAKLRLNPFTLVLFAGIGTTPLVSISIVIYLLTETRLRAMKAVSSRKKGRPEEQGDPEKLTFIRLCPPMDGN